MADAELIALLEALWRNPRPGPDNLLSSQAFLALTEYCDVQYRCGKTKFGLSNALRSLGLPCLLPAHQAELSLDAKSAAAAISDAFRQTISVRRHLCPLDLADELPPLSFGSTRVGIFSAKVLGAMFDAPRLARNFPTQHLETDRLAQFSWLVVEEKVEIDRPPEARAMPTFFRDMQHDNGEIQPHVGRFPPAVEAVLGFLLLAPWEEWSTMPEIDWRGFHIPWVYTNDSDLFIRPKTPPSPDSLTLEPWFFEDSGGQQIEVERPTTLRLDNAARLHLKSCTDSAWDTFQAALTSSLFETPVVHFLVRAFHADGMDEIMSHMTAIEAALGLEADHKRWNMPRSDRYKNVSATDRVAARMAAVLNDPSSAEAYKELFKLRSAFVHGRAGLQRVSTQERVRARSLACRVACALVDEAAKPAQPRADIMTHLLERGRVLLRSN